MIISSLPLWFSVLGWAVSTVEETLIYLLFSTLKSMLKHNISSTRGERQYFIVKHCVDSARFFCADSFSFFNTPNIDRHERVKKDFIGFLLKSRPDLLQLEQHHKEMLQEGSSTLKTYEMSSLSMWIMLSTHWLVALLKCV